MRSNSRENQDLVILSLFNKKRNGTYVEIGGATPIIDNTTFLLESEFDWSGISIEYNQNLQSQWHIRKNPCLCLDATTINYDELFALYNFPDVIDFLQLDIDPPKNTLKALQRINFEKYKFSFVTFEHDYYAGGSYGREESRRIFAHYGYVPLITDVSHRGLVFEDWYIHPTTIPFDNWNDFVGQGVNMNTPDLSSKYIALFEKYLS